MTEEKKELLNLNRGYVIILTVTKQDNLKFSKETDNVVLLGKNSYFVSFGAIKEYNFTNFIKGGNI